MNAAHWHLAMNHIPVVGAVFAACLLAVAFWRKSDESIRTSLGAMVVVAVLTIPVFLTGEPAEDVIMDMPDFPDALVKAHEKAATIALWVTMILGLAALGGLIRYRKATRVSRWFVGALLGLSLATSGLLGWTANLGGQIHHPEVRPAGAGTPAAKGGHE